MTASADRRFRIGVVIASLIYVLGAAALLLAPVSVTGALDVFSTWVRDTVGITAFGSGWFEFVANILFFVPLGLLLTLLVRHPWVGVLLALALSACAELAQALLPARTASMRDVLANVVGAAIGAAIAWVIIAARRRRSATEQLSSRTEAG